MHIRSESGSRRGACGACLFQVIMALCVGLPVPARAMAYYLSSSAGSDSYSDAQAHHPNTPWRSLSRLNAVLPHLHAGDSVFFKRGDYFFGTMRIDVSGEAAQPIYFGAYGRGQSPVIGGFTRLGKWVRKQGDIWETSFRAGDAAAGTYGLRETDRVVLINGSEQPIGRYPNSDAPGQGYLRIDSVAGNKFIVEDRAAPVREWRGGTIVIRKNHWVLDRNPITAQAGRRISFSSESPNGATAGFGYFIQNHPATLDRPGEWYCAEGDLYSDGLMRLGILLPSGPSSLEIQTSRIDTLISILHANYLVFEDIAFEGANVCAFCLRDAGFVTIRHCSIRFMAADGIRISDANHFLLLESRIDHIHNIAYRAIHSSYCQLRGNRFSNTGMIAGMGQGDSGSYEAIMSEGDDDKIEDNEIDSTGYIPITFSGNRIMIRHNRIDHFALVKDDAGGIYTWNNAPGALPHSGCHITGNIVLYGSGAGAGTDNPSAGQANGIYLDDHSTNIEVDNNTVAHCATYGIYIHNASQILIRGNTSFDNQAQIGVVQDRIAEGMPVEGISVHGNVFFPMAGPQLTAEYKTTGAIRSLGSFDSNFYCRPVEQDELIIGTREGAGRWIVYGLEGWQKATGEDLHSRAAPLRLYPHQGKGLREGALIRFEFNASGDRKPILLQGNYTDARGKTYSGKTELAPYSSVVLIKKT